MGAHPVGGRFWSSRLLVVGLAVMLALSLVGLDPGDARAATLTVTNANDSGGGSLRQAIASAADGDTIEFSPFFGTPRTISFGLLSTEMAITKNLTITGPGSGLLTIDAGDFARIFNLGDNTKTVAISGMTLTNGTVTGLGGSGGAIFNASTLSLTDVVVTGNQASLFGGGIASTGPLTITDSTIAQNTSGTSGGGLSNSALTTIIRSTIANNTAGSLGGGGLIVTNTLSLTDTTISGNTATSGDGGGVNVTGATTITGGTISGNTATSGNGGGVSNTGALTVTTTTVSGNTAGGTGALIGNGGGISISSGVLTVKRSTISGNSAAGTNSAAGLGGGLLVVNGGAASIIANSTVSGNSARLGGAIAINTVLGASTLTVQDSTIGVNTASVAANGIRVAGGALSGNNATLNIGNTILANTSGNIVKAGTTSRAFVNSQGGNVARDAAGLAGTNDLNSTDPLLDINGLQNNGGPTQTIALQAGSPALGNGIAATCSNANVGGVDQRGITRPQGAACDTGAVESRATTIAADNVRAPAGGTMTLKATLTDTSGTPAALSGRTIVFKLNGTQVCDNAGGGYPAACPTTDGSGLAQLPNVVVPAGPFGLNADAIEALFLGATDYLPSSDKADLTILVPQYIDFPQPGGKTYGDAPFAINATAKRQSDNSLTNLLVGFTSQTPLVCSVGGSSLAAGVSQATVTILAAGNCTIEATQDGDTTYAPATPVARTIAIGKKLLTVTAVNASRPYGSSVVPCTVTFTGFVSPDDASVISGAAGCTTTATTSSLPGTNHPLIPNVGTLTAANYAFGPFVNGTLSIDKAETSLTQVSLSGTYGSTSGTLTATLRRVIDNQPLSGKTVAFKINGVAACGVSGKPPCPTTNAQGVAALGGQTVPLRDAGTYNDYLIEASYAGDANYLPSVGVGKLVIKKAILWLKPKNQTVGLYQPNPTGCEIELANGSQFVNGDTYDDLDLDNLRCLYARSYPASNSTEYVGKTYRISAVGVMSANYDIRYQTGTLTVVP